MLITWKNGQTCKRHVEIEIPAGSLVRVSLLQTGDFIRTNKSNINKQIKWSEVIYQVYDVVDKHDPVMYYLREADNMENELTRAYFSHELQVIQKLIYRKDRPNSAKPVQKGVTNMKGIEKTEVEKRAEDGAAKSTRSKKQSIESDVLSLDTIKHF